MNHLLNNLFLNLTNNQINVCLKMDPVRLFKQKERKKEDLWKLWNCTASKFYRFDPYSRSCIKRAS